MSERAITCADCGVDTSFQTGVCHVYALRADLWQRVTPDGAAVLCLDCLELRLGRPVVPADFLMTPPEVFAQLAGQAVEVLPPEERQLELDAWRIRDEDDDAAAW